MVYGIDSSISSPIEVLLYFFQKEVELVEHYIAYNWAHDTPLWGPHMTGYYPVFEYCRVYQGFSDEF